MKDSKEGKKAKLKSALLRWHPDKFEKVLRMMGDGERGEVASQVGEIAKRLIQERTKFK